MNQQIIDIGYMIVSIGLMGMVVLVGIVGIVKVLRDIRNIKEQDMESNTMGELGMSCIVLIGYIWGKVWIHYKPDGNDIPNKENKKPKGVIKRGAEWEN